MLEHHGSSGCRQKGRGVPAAWQGRAGKCGERDSVAVVRSVDHQGRDPREEPLLLGPSVG